MSKSNHSKSSTTKALEKATKEWRSAKKRERAARNALAAIVNEAVASGVMSENKVASVTEIPRMTIRKMLGKDEAVSEAPVAAETAPETAQVIEAVPDAVIEAVPDTAIDAGPGKAMGGVADAGIEAVGAAAGSAERDSTAPDAAAEAAADVSEAGSEEIESPIAAVTSRPAPIWGASPAS